ncbi:MAG TPA: hypothetical protein VF857_11535, partial [Spirochaetota bacterium]
MRTLACIIITISLNATSLVAQSFNREKGLFDAFSSGNEYAFSEEIISYIHKYPRSVECYLLLHDLMNCTEIVGHQKIISELEKLTSLKEQQPIDAMIKRRAVDYLSLIKYHTRKGEGKIFAETYYPIMRWTLSKVFHRYGRGDLIFPYPDDLQPAFEQSQKSVSADLQGFIIPSQWSVKSDGVIYSHAVLDIPKESVVRIESKGEYLLFVNGAKVIQNIRGDHFRTTRLLRNSERGICVLSIKSFVSGEGIRVTLEDTQGMPIVPQYSSSMQMKERITFDEIDDYPLSELKSRAESPEKKFFLGWYFSDCESDEMFAYYESIAKNENPVFRFLLASELIDSGNREERESRVIDGYSRIDEILKSKPEFVPAYSLQLNRLIETSDPEKVIQFIDAAHRTILPDLSFCVRELSFLMEYLPDLAGKKAEEMMRRFPDSVSLQILRAQLLSKANPEKGLAECQKLVNTYRNESADILLDQTLQQEGRCPH